MSNADAKLLSSIEDEIMGLSKEILEKNTPACTKMPDPLPADFKVVGRDSYGIFRRYAAFMVCVAEIHVAYEKVADDFYNKYQRRIDAAERLTEPSQPLGELLAKYRELRRAADLAEQRRLLVQAATSLYILYNFPDLRPGDPIMYLPDGTVLTFKSEPTIAIIVGGASLASIFGKPN